MISTLVMLFVLSFVVCLDLRPLPRKRFEYYSEIAVMPTLILYIQGNESKHKHSVSYSEPLDKLLTPGKFYINEKLCYAVPDEFHGKLVYSSIILNLFLA